MDTLYNFSAQKSMYDVTGECNSSKEFLKRKNSNIPLLHRKVSSSNIKFVKSVNCYLKRFIILLKIRCSVTRPMKDCTATNTSHFKFFIILCPLDFCLKGRS